MLNKDETKEREKKKKKKCLMEIVLDVDGGKNTIGCMEIDLKKGITHSDDQIRETENEEKEKCARRHTSTTDD